MGALGIMGETAHLIPRVSPTYIRFKTKKPILSHKPSQFEDQTLVLELRQRNCNNLAVTIHSGYSSPKP